MYNRSPYGYSVSQGVSGNLMGKTLGYLVLLLVILMASVVVAPTFGTAGMWIGLIAAFIGTLMVSRRMNNAASTLVWGAIVAVGMGLLVAPAVLSTAVSNAGLLYSSVFGVVVAVALSAAVVSFIPWDFSRLGPILFVGLLMLVITSVLGMILPGVTGLLMSRAYNIFGILIFTGYLMLDFSLMRSRGRMLPQEGAAVALAVFLLVDIVNLFLFFLRLGRD